MRFATCSFPEFRPEMGIPVRSSRGFPRYKLRYPLVHKMPSTFPARHWLDLDYDEFDQLYRQHVRANLNLILSEADQVRHAAADHDSPLVLLCFEQLHRPGQWCHRRILAHALEELTGELIVEHGRVQESAPEPPPMLF